MVEWSVDPSVVRMVGESLVGHSAVWSGLSISRSVAMSFDRLQGCWLVGCLLVGMVGCLIVGFVCMLFFRAVVASVSELFGRLVVGMIGLLIG